MNQRREMMNPLKMTPKKIVKTIYIIFTLTLFVGCSNRLEYSYQLSVMGYSSDGALSLVNMYTDYYINLPKNSNIGYYLILEDSFFNSANMFFEREISKFKKEEIDLSVIDEITKNTIFFLNKNVESDYRYHIDLKRFEVLF